MLILPWYIRMSIDIVIIATPFLYLHNHHTPFIFEYFRNKRRIKRRKSIEQCDIYDKSPQSIQQIKSIYQNLGREI